MVLGIMNNRNVVSSLFMMIGGILSIIPVLPLISNFFPIYSYTVNGVAGNQFTATYSFWATVIELKYNENKYLGPGPSGWSPLSLPSYILILIFFTLGMSAI